MILFHFECESNGENGGQSRMFVSRVEILPSVL